ncbi:PREDICTED: mitochondrial substrate carrier family protein X-like [Amphimedon queenslandica]|uniref:Mitochondrial carrier protein n=1 Tax=Amphimedon queenslandica TaxID=400682 RepID=A0A1X7UWU6_AMPQE|nr:PREDICTED: mitochondrial substrate carrier family protein X-like [Amphimedon queenslandica]|eukprot:XP_003386558.1 PREDICTED: mitochondrial substrate carrier family protein X-like [Amphimedon queenslandica]
MDTAKQWILNGTASGLAACTSHLIHHPLYTYKSQTMYHGQSFHGFWAFLKQAKDSGRLRFLYRGLPPRMLAIMPEKIMKMYAWDLSRGYISNKYPEAKYTKWIIAGAFAGAATTVVGCPSERIMVLSQVRKQGFVQVIKDQGLKGLYKGWTATLYRDILFNITLFTTRELFKEQYKSKKGKTDLNVVESIVLGLVPGFLAAVIGCPHDVVKTRMQGAKLDTPYRSCSTIFFDILRNEGPRNLMKGLIPRLIAVPSMMAWFVALDEEFKKRI